MLALRERGSTMILRVLRRKTLLVLIRRMAIILGLALD
jgi:hypothetical protein